MAFESWLIKIGQVKRNGIRLAWEPRGEAWTADLVRGLCADYRLVHCVDPLEADSVYGDITYWRLHGRGSYAYRYTDDDLVLLREMLARRQQPGFLMFNNFSSRTDALRFRALPSKLNLQAGKPPRKLA